jgi:putative SOS response-associated peptidase YedK
MCGRATYKLTWEEVVALYRLTLGTAPHNFQPRFKVYPTAKIDAVIERDGKRILERMRWGLVSLLDDHLAGGKHAAADVVAKAEVVLSETELLRAMFVVGYFPPNTPPDE